MQQEGHLNLDLNSAEDFLDHLGTGGPLSRDYHYPGGWIFRGQKDATRDLTPSAFRKGVKLMHPQGHWVDGVQKTVRRQIWHEAATLLYFLGMADQNGLALPEDTQYSRRLLRKICCHLVGGEESARKEIESALESGQSRWPPDELLSLMALAQHFGLPTRLLDWSHSPYVAAYFAAEAAASLSVRDPIKTHVCVWALSNLDLNHDSFFGQDDTRSQELVVFTAPGATNSNLLAQRGLFTLYRPQNVELEGAFAPYNWDSLLSSRLCASQNSPILHKISLPVSEAPKLLRLLAKKFVNGASIYPGFDGVVKALKERQHWDLHDDLTEI